MNQPGHGQPPAMGIIGTGAQLDYQQYQMTGTPNPGSLGGIQSTCQHTGAQLAYQQYHQQQLHQEIEKVKDFKNHSLPLARIKKIMKADEDVKMISAEAPVVFSKACEMFILELTSCSWNHTEENKRRTLQRNYIAAAITRTDIFDFLVDIVPREDLKDEILASVPQGTMHVGGPADALPYYMAPQIGTTPGMIMDPSIYGQQSNPYMAQPDPSIYGQQSNPYMAQPDPSIYGQQSNPYMAHPMWPPGSDQQQPSSDH